jgi:hypothetical protein
LIKNVRESDPGDGKGEVNALNRILINTVNEKARNKSGYSC